ncbi:hypothetical protein [Kitasatospora sp. NPDC097643]|uniref:hypothetical protein n=1 Tax=Kitasatospora sp. NPDC097643 TaxID=3157230 RepID=UPI00331E8BFB
MHDRPRPPRLFRAAGPLLLAAAAWACSVPTFVADEDVRALVSRCHNSPGAPAYVLPLAWVGVVLGLGAVGWGGWQVVTTARRNALGVGGILLCAALPVMALGLLVQAAGIQTAADRTGPQRHTCAGQPPLRTGPAAAVATGVRSGG